MIITKEWLSSHGACDGGYKWAVPVLGGGMPLSKFAKKFNRADWLVWLLCEADVLTHQQKVLLACMYARTVLHLVPKGEERPRLAIEAVEAWAKNPSAATRDAVWAAMWAASTTAGDAAMAATHKSMVKGTLERLDAWGVFSKRPGTKTTTGPMNTETKPEPCPFYGSEADGRDGTMSKRAKNRSVPGYFDAGYKTSYQKMKKKYDLLLAERKEIGDFATTAENTWKAYADDNDMLKRILIRVLAASDELMEAAINAKVEWESDDMDGASFSNNFNARMLALDWKIESTAKVLDPEIPGLERKKYGKKP